MSAAAAGAARLEVAQPELSAGDAEMQVVETPAATAWSLGAERALPRLFGGLRGAFGVTLAQPLRTESGAVRLSVPVGEDVTGAPVFEERTAAVTPSGREVNLETTVRLRLADGAETAIAARLTDDPGHVASADPQGMVWLGLRLTR